MKRITSFVLLLSLCLPTVALAVGGKKAAYVGGTVEGVKDRAEGTFDTSNAAALRFDAKKDGAFSIRYRDITSLEYGQKAGRRVAVAVLVSPLALFSKKRNHYLTIS